MRERLAVALAAALWGLIGLFVHGLVAAGLPPLAIVFTRAASSAFVLFGALALCCPAALRFRPRHLLYFAGMGALGLALPNWAYFTTISWASLSVAVAFLYTGPAFVVLLARIFFREPLCAAKVLALLFTTAGAALVAGIGEQAGLRLSPLAFSTGLLSGLGYALYSIFGKFLNRHYPSLTVTAYSFLFAALVLLPVAPLSGIFRALSVPSALASVGALTLLATVLPYWLYNSGLKGLEAGRAAILAALEPLVAALIGYLFLGDRLTSWQLAGFAAILVGAVLGTGTASSSTASCPEPGAFN
ncbi:DMT family transporter [Ammonifex thiophilus]|nr:EamA family transporter [Ammonifex thiophilus]